MLSELSSVLRTPAPPARVSQVSAAWSERLQLLLESTGEGIFGIDLAGRCTFVNRAAAEIDSTPGRGTIVCLTMPLPEVA